MNAKPRHGLTEFAADAAVEQACRMLRLPTIRAQFRVSGGSRSSIARPTGVAQQLADDTVLITVLANDAAAARREVTDLCDEARPGCA
jgi:hypothetical protein